MSDDPLTDAPRLLARRPDEALPSDRTRRLVAGVVALGCVSVLAVAAGLTPSGEGHGTHEQLGLEPCGFLSATGLPCATCGMTTSWTHAAEGDYLSAFATQPFGAVLALLTSMVFWLALHVAVFGSRIGEAASRTLSDKVAWYAVGGLALGWVYKIVVMA